MEDVTFEFLKSLVQLSTFPEEEWIGKTVYHPMGGQSGNVPFWRFEDMDELCKEIEREFETPEYPIDWLELVYDVGIVYRIKDRDPDFDFGKDVWFGDNGPDGFCLVYNSDNLWTEKPTTTDEIKGE